MKYKSTAKKFEIKMAAALNRLDKPKTTNQLAVEMGISYAVAQNIIKKLIVKKRLKRITSIVQTKRNRYIANPVEVEEETMTAIERLHAKNLIIAQLLPVWQTAAAIACRIDVTRYNTYKLLTEMYNEGFIHRSRFRMTENNHKFFCYRKVEQIKIMGAFMPVQCEEIEDEIC